MNEQRAPLDLTPAETALERGDYGQCLEQLSPLAESRPLPDPEGARIRLLMVTALMGQGRDQEALTICQLLSRSGEPQLRQQARQLLTILEVPVVGPSGKLVHETSPALNPGQWRRGTGGVPATPLSQTATTAATTDRPYPTSSPGVRRPGHRGAAGPDRGPQRLRSHAGRCP